MKIKDYIRRIRREPTGLPKLSPEEKQYLRKIKRLNKMSAEEYKRAIEENYTYITERLAGVFGVEPEELPEEIKEFVREYAEELGPVPSLAQLEASALRIYSDYQYVSAPFDDDRAYRWSREILELLGDI